MLQSVVLSRVLLSTQPGWVGCLPQKCTLRKKCPKSVWILYEFQCINFVDFLDCYFFTGEADILNAALGNYKSIIAEGYIGILMCSSPWSCKDKSSHFA